MNHSIKKNQFEDNGFYEDLVELLSREVLNYSEEQIRGIYQTWNEKWDETTTRKIKLNKDQIHFNQAIPINSILNGIDLPIWFGEEMNKRVVILGIDPMRNRKDFIESMADIKSEVLIGAPYSFNQKKSRENECRSYWTLIEGIVKANCFVYCTDIFKTYFFNKEKNIRSYNDIEYTKNENHLKILLKELDIIQPDVIIVFGVLAHNFLMQSKSCPKISQSINSTKKSLSLKSKSAEVYTVLHLSKTPRGQVFKTFFESNQVDLIEVDVENRVHCALKYIDVFKRLGILN